MQPNEQTARIDRMIERIRHILAEEPTFEVGAVLAQLSAMWFAGHLYVEEMDQSERPKTAELREQLISDYIDLVRDLIKPCDESIRQRLKAGTLKPESP